MIRSALKIIQKLIFLTYKMILSRHNESQKKKPKKTKKPNKERHATAIYLFSSDK